jgi:uncharacterized membrane protein
VGLTLQTYQISEGTWFIESLPIGGSDTLIVTFQVPADAKHGVAIKAIADGISATKHS